jgi:MFS family permease
MRDGRAYKVSKMEIEAHSVNASLDFGLLGQAILLMAAALTAIDAFIVNVALPSIQETFHVSASISQFVVSCYGIVYALLLVFGGRFGDRYGRRRLIQIGVIGFTAASLACGIAPNIGTLIGSRIVQGAAAALLTPQILATIQTSLTEPAKTRAVSYYGAIGGLSIAVGQLLGGLFVWSDIAGLGWRPIFLVNVPLGVLTMIGTRLQLPETKAAQARNADLGGTALFGITVLALMIPLGVGQQLHWPLWSMALMAVAVVAGVALWRYERRIEAAGAAPLIAPSLIKLSTVRRGLLVLGSGFLAWGGFTFVFSLAVQNGNGMNALESGLSLAPMAAGQMLTALKVPKLIGKLGVVVLRISGAVYVCGLLCIIVPTLLWWPHLRFFELIPGTFLIGVGNGLFVPIVFRTVLSVIPKNQAGVGSGIVSTTQRTTVAFGVAALDAMFVGISDQSGMRLGFVVVAAVFLVIGATYALFGGLIETGGSVQ